ncbi:hypothetical protein ACLB2K_062853 [Fragaria x ananassa]
MQSRVGGLEEGKDPGGSLLKTRALPFRLIQFLLMFVVLGLGISILSMHTIRYFGVQHMAPAEPSTMRSCFAEPNTLESWIRPPSSLLHNMNDTELLWLASMAPQVKEYPFKRVPKIAFMFLTKGPLPMEPLWERFFKGHEGLYSIYVHSLPSYTPNFSATSVFYKRQIPSKLAEWGEMNMCEAERRLLANALLDISNEWFILLSESCIPLSNLSIVYHYLSRSRYSFMGSFDEIGPYGRGRYNEYMAPLVNLSNWRKGSQWFEINRELAHMIVQDVSYYPVFRDYCKPACYVDEHYFQTMLTIETPYLLANRTLTYVDWSRGGAHPATFGKNDITVEFFKKITTSEQCLYNNQPTSLCFLFARKFAPSALEPLLELASDVFGF